MKNLTYIVPHAGIENVPPEQVDAYIRQNRPIPHALGLFLTRGAGCMLLLLGVICSLGWGMVVITARDSLTEAHVIFGLASALIFVIGLLLFTGYPRLGDILRRNQGTNGNRLTLRILQYRDSKRLRWDLIWAPAVASKTDEAAETQRLKKLYLAETPFILIRPTAKGMTGECRYQRWQSEDGLTIRYTIVEMYWEPTRPAESTFLLEDDKGNRQWQRIEEICDLLRECWKTSGQISLRRIHETPASKDSAASNAAAES